jgi:acyl-[acyl-carrier-protein]-phospholipid O-acyltransferase/long-chain-fatty-acid--[acyl-carrier-protein] ligase
VPDDRRGERLVLLYTNADVSEDLIQARLSESGLPALWIPKKEDMHVVEALPVSGTGKLDLGSARRLAAEIAGRVGQVPI